VQASLEGRESSAIAEVTQPTECFLGIVARDETNELLANLDAKLKQSEASTGTARRQTEGHNGNQKRPAFASHVSKKLLRGRQPEGVLPIQGGTTDAGLHTGCIHGNTSFPLVLSSVRAMLRLVGEPNDELFEKCIVARYLQISGRHFDHPVEFLAG
jgi:hypothetical protein